MRRSREEYDAIISVHTISNAVVASGALSLAESYVLTREAFEDYLDHLTPDGMIFFTRPEFQIPRLLSTARIGVRTPWNGLDCQSCVRIQRSGTAADGGSFVFCGGISVEESEIPTQ